VPFLAEKIPEDDRELVELIVGKADLLGAVGEEILRLAPGGDARKVTLDIGAKTGTPALAKPSASTCSVTVLPVPVAPVTSPWRLPNLRSRYSPLLMLSSGLRLAPMKILPSSSM